MPDSSKAAMRQQQQQEGEQLRVPPYHTQLLAALGLKDECAVEAAAEAIRGHKKVHANMVEALRLLCGSTGFMPSTLRAALLQLLLELQLLLPTPEIMQQQCP